MTGRKIFVSYKYADSNVQNLESRKNSTVRDYVTAFEDILVESDHIYKGESDDEDLSKLSEDIIWKTSRDRIYDSSITVIFISPGMREFGKKDREQWIPWEISYSLQETSRHNSAGKAITSKTNAMVAVVLPDQKGSYSYCLENKKCCKIGCIYYHNEELFQIIRENQFNYTDANPEKCSHGFKLWEGEHSYIEAVAWDEFISDYDSHLIAAANRQNDIDNYKIVKTIK